MINYERSVVSCHHDVRTEDVDEYYFFEHMLIVTHDGFMCSFMIQDDIAYYYSTGKKWLIDETFPWEEYKAWVNNKMEQDLLEI